jgi:hypothetical protein
MSLLRRFSFICSFFSILTLSVITVFTPGNRTVAAGLPEATGSALTDSYSTRSLDPAMKEPIAHVCIVDIDGCRRDALYGLLMKNPQSIPNIARIVLGDEVMAEIHEGTLRYMGDEGESGQYMAVEWATTVFPSYTFACQAALFTGCYPVGTGIPGNEYFDRFTEKRFAFSGGSVSDLDQIAGVYEYDFMPLGKDSPCEYLLSEVTDPADWRYGGFANRQLACATLYEEAALTGLSSIIAFNMYHSPDYHENPYITWVRPTKDDMCTYLLDDAWDYDNSMMTQLIDRMYQYEQVPEIITAYFAGHDHYCHYHDNGQKYYLRKYVDHEVGRLIECFEGLGIYSHTLFVITTDHGMMDVVADDEHSIVMEDELEEVIEDYTNWWGWPHFDVFDWSDWFFNDDFSAYVALNGGLAHIYLRNLDTEEWSDFPRWEDIEAVADLLLDYNYFIASQGSNSVNPLTGSEKLEMILVRDPERWGQWDAPYRVFTGAGQPVYDVEEYIEEHWPEFPYVDAPWMLQNLVSHKSGDIIVLPDRDHGYTISEEVENDHGSIYPGDMYIPLIFAGPPLSGTARLIPQGRIVDVAPTVAELLNFALPEAQGTSLASFLYRR